MDDDDEFYDTISIASRRTGPGGGRNYLSLSRNTVYHSAVDLDGMELAPLDRNGPSGSKRNDKVYKDRDVKTYTQWRDRVQFKLVQFI